jgi:CheY-like chemotaxis protein
MRITPSHLQISASQGYNKQQLHGRIKNPTLKRILVIDDNDDINLVFKVGLEENGFVADSFAEPLTALQNFKADLLDQLIIDIMMPALNSLNLNQEMEG